MRNKLMGGIAVVLLGLLSLGVIGTRNVFAQQEQPAARLPLAAAITGGNEEQAALANQLVQERQAAYQAQLDELSRRIESGNALVEALTADEQALQQQLAQLQQARGQRAAAYQTQMDAIGAEYAARFAQYAGQLQEAQVLLAEANVQLGR